MALSSSKCENRKMATSLKMKAIVASSLGLICTPRVSFYFAHSFRHLLIVVSHDFIDPFTVRSMWRIVYGILKAANSHPILQSATIPTMNTAHTHTHKNNTTQRTLNYFCLESSFFTSVLYNQQNFSTHFLVLIFVLAIYCIQFNSVQFSCTFAIDHLILDLYVLFRIKIVYFPLCLGIVCIYILIKYVHFDSSLQIPCCSVCSFQTSSFSFGWPNFFPLSFSLFFNSISFSFRRSFSPNKRCYSNIKQASVCKRCANIFIYIWIHWISVYSSIQVTILKWLISECKMKPRCCWTFFFICIWMDAHIFSFFLHFFFQSIFLRYSYFSSLSCPSLVFLNSNGWVWA